MRADATGHRHFRDGNREPTIGQIVDGGYQPVPDQPADKVPISSFRDKIHGRRRPLFKPADFA